MLQNMIMYVFARCVFIVTTKCKAMKNIHHKEQDDQETSNLKEQDDQETSNLLYFFILFSYKIQAHHQQSEKLTMRKNYIR